MIQRDPAAHIVPPKLKPSWDLADYWHPELNGFVPLASQKQNVMRLISLLTYTTLLTHVKEKRFLHGLDYIFAAFPH